MFRNLFSEEDGIRHYKILINGCWNCTVSGGKIDVYNPYTWKVFASVPACSAEDVLSAINSAKNHSEFAKFKPVERLEIIEKTAQIMSENLEEIASVITMESGKPLSVSRGEVKATVERLRLAPQEVRALYGEYLPGEWIEDTANKFAIVLRKPLGVIATISSFNYPLYIAAAKIIPALLAGNTVVAKPASDTPLALIYFARILELAGLPAGALNIVTGSGKDVGDVLVSSEDVSAISFTGSTAVGEHIAKIAGIKKLHLELGGKAAAIVLKDADLKNAAAQIVRGSFRNSGQRCDAVSRVIAVKEIKEKLVEEILAEAEKYPSGDPLCDKTQVGPLINKKALINVEELVDDAVSSGGRILLGGKSSGLVMEPTVIDNVNPSMRIAKEEIFGPVIPIMTVADHEEAVALSNSSEYGLDSCIFTENINLALRIAKQLQDGSVTVNSAPAHGVGHFPFGGNKKSGLGREGLGYSIDELTKLHTVIITER